MVQLDSYRIGIGDRILNIKLLTYDIKVSRSISRKVKVFSKDYTTTGVIFSNLLSCARRGSVLVYSRNTGEKLRVKSKKGLNVRKVIKAIDNLVILGYVDNFIGKPSRDHRYREISYILPTDKFYDEFVNEEDVMEAENNYLEGVSVIELRDEDKNSIPFHMTNKVKEMESVVRELNKRLNDCEIKDKNGINITNMYCRIFNENFENGGRFYRANILSIKNRDTKDRLRITINDEPVCEVDYSNLHFRIAAATEEIDSDFIPLDIYSEILEDKENKVDRSIVKFATNIMFNCNNRGTAVKAINSKINKLTKEEKEQYSLGGGKSVVALISDSYPEFDYLFCNEMNYGSTLQCADSNLTSLIITELLSLGIPVLPIHDSFIVPLKHMDTLIRLMADKFRELFGWEDIVPLGISYIDDRGVLIDEKIVA